LLRTEQVGRKKGRTGEGESGRREWLTKGRIGIKVEQKGENRQRLSRKERTEKVEETGENR
jgi:hypothetical protein